MKISQHRNYRFFQSFQKIVQDLAISDSLLSFQRNHHQFDFKLEELTELRIKKGCFFSKLIIINGDHKCFVLKGYKNDQLQLFKQRAQQKIVNLISQSDCWQRFELAIERYGSNAVYFSSYQWQPLVELSQLFTRLEPLGLNSEHFTDPSQKYLLKLAKIFTSDRVSDLGRRAHNKNVVVELLNRYKPFFDRIEKMPLTNKQRIACLTDDDHTLVNAGAGSGKTATLVAKAGYIIQSDLAQADEILILAFGNKAAEEMSERLGKQLPSVAAKIQVSTFHGLGKEVIAQCSQSKLSLADFAINKPQLVKYIEHVVSQLEISNKQYAQLLADFYAIAEDNRSVVVRNSVNKSLIDLIIQFLSLYKEGSFSVDNLKAQLNLANGLDFSATEKHRIQLFLQLFEPILNSYEKYLTDNQCYDFSDMISKASSLINLHKYSHKFKYILVDEFQDISKGRANLLRSLLGQGSNTRLFAVGDDWQSIYRFNGADINLFTNFTETFISSSLVALDKTFRFNNKIHQLSSNFVLQNPQQTKKDITSHCNIRSKAFRVFDVQKESSLPPKNQKVDLTNEDQKVNYDEALQRSLNTLNSSMWKKKKRASVLIIGRYAYTNMSILSQCDLVNHNFNALDITYQTAHGSKGLEADYVIVVDVNIGSFPSIRENDPILDLVLGKKEPYLYAEERRLFYVALTRAKHFVYLLFDSSKESPFIEEVYQILSTNSEGV